ncbi:MAG: MlaD family protein [Rickettsiales bacterium]
MESKQNYFVVGCFVLAGIVAMFFFVIWLTGNGEDIQYKQYRIYFTQSVSGLNQGATVKYRGVEVGRIQTISIDPSNSERIRVTIRIQDTTPVKTDTYATLKPQGITGLTYIELTGGTREAPRLEAKEGKVAVIPSTPSSFDQIVTNIPMLMEKLNTLVEQTNKMFDDKNVAAFSATLGNVQGFTANLNDNTKQINSLLEQTNVAMTNLAQTSESIRKLSDESRYDVKVTIEKTKEAVEELTSLLQKSNRFAGQGYHELNGVLVEMKKTLRELDALGNSLNRDPAQLLFSPNYKGYKVP